MNKLVAQNLLSFLRQPLGKRIDQKAVEQWAASFWKLARQDQPGQDGAPYVIMFPPPNITGNLHLGHALTGAIQDALVRQKRMLGHQCLYIPGFDHAGLGTQTVVESQLMKQKGMNRLQVGRDKFIELSDQWKDRKRSEMRDQLYRLGLDLNHEREYFTMDDNSSRAVHEAFKKLFRLKIIYRSTKLIFWSESLQTTLSDIEVENLDGQNRYIRTGEVVSRRPISQWFIKTEELAKRAVEVVEKGSITMIPSGQKNSWRGWLVGPGAQDWCISRQSWWGHRIPAYKLSSQADENSNWVVADNLDEAKQLLGVNDENDITQDGDVLDTWFSSSLLPLSISGWPDEERFGSNCKGGQFPLQIMETGLDILTFWVSKMVMMSLALTDLIPFRLVLLHGMICDSRGKKMSKSLGNVIDPLDLIDGVSLKALQDRTLESHAQGLLADRNLQPVLDTQQKLFPKGIPLCGADGLRACLLSHDFLEAEIKLHIDGIDQHRRFLNKIWNVFRFVLSLSEKNDSKRRDLRAVDITMVDRTKLDEADMGLLGELAECVRVSHEVFNDSFKLHQSFLRLESFFVKHLSHDYIEKAKGQLFDKDSNLEEYERRFQVLVLSLETSIKLLHPFMPHITEFLYQKMADNVHIDQETNHLMSLGLLSKQSFPSTCDWNALVVNQR